MKKPVFSCLNVFEKRVTLHCHQQFEKFLYIVCIQSVIIFSSHSVSESKAYFLNERKRQNIPKKHIKSIIHSVL